MAAIFLDLSVFLHWTVRTKRMKVIKMRYFNAGNNLRNCVFVALIDIISVSTKLWNSRDQSNRSPTHVSYAFCVCVYTVCVGYSHQTVLISSDYLSLRKGSAFVNVNIIYFCVCSVVCSDVCIWFGDALSTYITNARLYIGDTETPLFPETCIYWYGIAYANFIISMGCFVFPFITL